MKRTALKRKIPLKRGKSMRRVSPTKAAWNRRYMADKRQRLTKQRSEVGYTFCEKCGVRCQPDGHHPNGQNGANILIFVLLCRRDHAWVGDHANTARAQGWLAPR